ncbi:MAG: cell division protein FtsA [Victivallales bacterium]|nr:cell division protein FtsA [Victivallales bacterium]
MRKRTQVITGIDIGTSNIRVLIGEYDYNTENIKIIGYSEKKSEGVIKGEISDLLKVSVILEEAVKEAEHVSNKVISSEHLYTAVTGSHIRTSEGNGTILINSENKVVTQQHISEVLKSTRSQFAPPDCIMLDTIDGSFIIDNTYHVLDPAGHSASKLEAHTHIIYANKNRVESYVNLIKDQGFETVIPVFSGTATALSVLTSDDFDHGTLVINMGGGTTEYTVFNNYTATVSSVLSVGINHIINDLCLGLEIDFPFAREIFSSGIVQDKKKNGEEYIEKKGTLKTRKIPIVSIEKIIELRLKETFEIIYEKLENNYQINTLNNGIILCGGISSVPGIHNIVSDVFDMPVITGTAQNFSGPENIVNNSGFLTAVGLLRYGAHEIENSRQTTKSVIRNIDHKLWSFWKKIWRALINE